MKNMEYRGQTATVLENNVLRVIVLPQRGGKTASILHKETGFEVLHQPECYPPLTPGMPFDRGDASGFDDVFPSMGEADLPDHGEIWTAVMQTQPAADKLRMHCDCKTLPYRYMKQVSLHGSHVTYEYTIENVSQQTLPCIWVCHCLMRLEEGVRFVFTQECAEAENVIGGGILGAHGRLHPTEALTAPPPDGTVEKFYLTTPVQHGICRAIYLASGMAVTMTYDAQALPYLGFWATNGGYRGERNFAFEPATSYYDTIACAAERNRLKRLAPGEQLRFTLSLDVSRMPVDEPVIFGQRETAEA